MPPRDRELMARIQAGEVELFDLLVERYRAALVRVAWSKLGNAAWAEDVAQEALLAAYAARMTYNPAFEFRTWLWTILLNLCRRQWQRRERRPQEESCSHTADWARAGIAEPATPESGLAAALRTERRELLHHALQQLPEPQADALRLRFLGGLPFAEIALTMDSSESAAKQRVRNGLQALAELLDDQN